MQLVSQSEFSRLLGVSRQGVRDAVKRGALKIILSDGKPKIDLDDPQSKDYLKRDNKNRSPDNQKNVKQKCKPIVKKNDIKIKSMEKNAEQLLENIIVDDNKEKVDSQGLNKYDLECSKLIEQTKLLEIKIAEQKKELFDRDIIIKFVSDLYSIEQSEFLQFSKKLSADIMALCEISENKKQLQIEKLLETESYATLNHISILITKMLENLK
jgi:hypothetical protein